MRPSELAARFDTRVDMSPLIYDICKCFTS